MNRKAIEKQQIRNFKRMLHESSIVIKIDYQIVENEYSTIGTQGTPYENVKALIEEKDMLVNKDNKMINVISNKIIFKIDSSYQFTDLMRNIMVTWKDRRFPIDKAAPSVLLSNGKFLCTKLIQV
jgi:hypothetical protein